MGRLCTHCKQVETDSEDFKYCLSCYDKFQKWLKDKSHTEPESVARDVSYRPQGRDGFFASKRAKRLIEGDDE